MNKKLSNYRLKRQLQSYPIMISEGLGDQITEFSVKIPTETPLFTITIDGNEDADIYAQNYKPA